MRNRSVLLIVFLIALLSCKDDEPTLSKTDLLTSKSWKLEFIRLLDIESAPKDCAKDNIYIFNLDKTSIEDEGPSKCDPDNSQIKKGIWDLTQNETILRLTSNINSSTPFSVDEQILELTTTNLKVKYTILGFEIEEHYIH